MSYRQAGIDGAHNHNGTLESALPGTDDTRPFGLLAFIAESLKYAAQIQRVKSRSQV
jgi:hypothetical protein